MNYIKQLQQDKAELEQELATISEGISDIYRYLSLPKFDADTTVQTRDILLRLDEIKNSSISVLTAN